LYDKITQNEYVEEQKKFAESKGMKIEYFRKKIQLTDFGNQFINICVKNK